MQLCQCPHSSLQEGKNFSILLSSGCLSVFCLASLDLNSNPILILETQIWSQISGTQCFKPEVYLQCQSRLKAGVPLLHQTAV